MSAYEVVPYDDRPVAETHPDRLHVAGRVAGVAVAGPEGMRVLELGCAHGVNLLPMAFHLPDARFVGVDLSPRQIELGCARVRELGLCNLELRCADVMDFDPGREPFDVVIAHGLFSWVPDHVRDRVLALCRAALAPSGVAYISYNAMPAWGVRGSIRRALLAIVGDATDDRDRVRRARAGLERLAQIQPLRGTAEGAVLAQEIADLQDKPDAYLLHEYLVPFSRAYWLREFMALADAAGLRWLDDVAPTGLPEDETADVTAAMAELVDDSRTALELADIVTFRQFRASLLVRDDAPRTDPRVDAGFAPAPELTPELTPHLAWLRTMRLAAPPRDDLPHDPVLVALREQWPGDLAFDALHAALELPLHTLALALAEHHRAHRVQLRPRSLPYPALSTIERPVVTALTRFEARQLPFVTTPQHECAPLDAFHAALIRHLDGTRTREQIAHALATDVLDGHLKVAAGPVPTRARLHAGLPELVDAALGRLCAAGLLFAG